MSTSSQKFVSEHPETSNILLKYKQDLLNLTTLRRSIPEQKDKILANSGHEKDIDDISRIGKMV